jgi:hypothetical protein
MLGKFEIKNSQNNKYFKNKRMCECVSVGHIHQPIAEKQTQTDLISARILIDAEHTIVIRFGRLLAAAALAA